MYNTLIDVSFATISGFIIYAALVLIKQNWVNTVHYFITFLLLPPITFIITKVISNNLALSLGMIGALSIVRFRNPVKNPLELVIYFGLITCGISYGVNYKYGLLLVSIIISILIISRIFEIIVKKNNQLNLFRYSFSTNDGVNKSIIEIEAKNKINFLENNKDLVYQSINTNKYYYKLSQSDKKMINQIKEKAENNDEVLSIEVIYGD